MTVKLSKAEVEKIIKNYLDATLCVKTVKATFMESGHHEHDFEMSIPFEYVEVSVQEI